MHPWREEDEDKSKTSKFPFESIPEWWWLNLLLMDKGEKCSPLSCFPACYTVAIIFRVRPSLMSSFFYSFSLISRQLFWKRWQWKIAADTPTAYIRLLWSYFRAESSSFLITRWCQDARMKPNKLGLKTVSKSSPWNTGIHEPPLLNRYSDHHQCSWPALLYPSMHWAFCALDILTWYVMEDLVLCAYDASLVSHLEEQDTTNPPSTSGVFYKWVIIATDYLKEEGGGDSNYISRRCKNWGSTKICRWGHDLQVGYSCFTVHPHIQATKKLNHSSDL